MRIREAQPGDEAGIARVRVDSWRTTYRGILPDDYLDGLSYDTYLNTWVNILRSEGRMGYAYVAENQAGQVVGFAVGGAERTNNPIYRGELYAIYLLKRYQHRGLGRGLVSAFARCLLREQLETMLVWVLEQNPARLFYEALGGKLVEQQEILIGQNSYPQMAYGWEDIRPLAELATG